MTSLESLKTSRREAFEREFCITFGNPSQSVGLGDWITESQFKDFNDETIDLVWKEAIEDIALAVSTNAGQEIIERQNATAPTDRANHLGYMACIEHVEVILKNRLRTLRSTDSNQKTP